MLVCVLLQVQLNSNWALIVVNKVIGRMHSLMWEKRRGGTFNCAVVNLFTLAPNTSLFISSCLTLFTLDHTTSTSMSPCLNLFTLAPNTSTFISTCPNLFTLAPNISTSIFIAWPCSHQLLIRLQLHSLPHPIFHDTSMAFPSHVHAFWTKENKLFAFCVRQEVHANS